MNGVGVIRPDYDSADEKNGRQANKSHATSAHNSFGHYTQKSFKLHKVQKILSFFSTANRKRLQKNMNINSWIVICGYLGVYNSSSNTMLFLMNFFSALVVNFLQITLFNINFPRPQSLRNSKQN